MKCGTTSLWRYLQQHPQIRLPPGLKNLEFFNEAANWERGTPWYENFFPQTLPDGTVAGEVSTEYTKHPVMPGVPERMARVVPEARLIYLVRHPIKRIISQYLHMIDIGTEQLDIDATLSGPNAHRYIDISRYAWQLDQFLPYYPTERILLVRSEDLRRQAVETLKKVLTVTTRAHR